MPSSTSRLAFSDWRLIALLTGIAIASPVAVLVLQQIDYILSYQACAERSNMWVVTPTLVGGIAVGGLVAAAWLGHRRSSGDGPPRTFLSVVALLMAVLSLLIVLAFALGPLVLDPCDF